MLATTGPYCLYIHAAGNAKRARPWLLPQRRLTHYLLVCSQSGEEQLVVGGAPHTIPAGGSYLIAPGVLSDIGSKRGNRPVWIHFDVVWNPERAATPYAGHYDADLSWRAKFLQPGPREVWGVELPVRVPAQLEALFTESIPRIVELSQSRERLATLEATTELGRILASWVATAWIRKPGGDGLNLEARLARAESLARQSVAADFSVADFAAAANFSRSQFSALYQKVRGISPGTFLRQERMRQAMALLARSDLPLNKVGAMVGYPDASVFGRVFRAAHGVSPRVWRQRNA